VHLNPDVVPQVASFVLKVFIALLVLSSTIFAAG